MQPRPLNEAIKPISWLLGKWVSEDGKGEYPSIKPFNYCEEITFESYGQPLIHYTAKSWHPIEKKPMHFESGFLRIQPGTNNLAFMVAHNFGLTTLEEGFVSENEIVLESKSIARMNFAKEPGVKKIARIFKLTDEKLVQVLKLETNNTSLEDHTLATYKRILDR
ncbi:peroxynitrite isomerase THAP4-like [Lycorma delicatula]|uniref:peroxynitrite isomerase THAP4-like n=1 Tax=Lycorma delicatula TaxID=130591 RepID=UPI003F511E6F